MPLLGARNFTSRVARALAPHLQQSAATAVVFSWQ